MIGKLGGSTGIGEHTGLTPRVATLLFDVARVSRHRKRVRPIHRLNRKESSKHTDLQRSFAGCQIQCHVFLNHSREKESSSKKMSGTLPPQYPPPLPRVHQAADPTHEFLVESSFLEIYNEKVLDLLEPSTDPDTLKIRESPQLGVHVVGLTKRHVKSATEVVRTLITGFMVSVFFMISLTTHTCFLRCSFRFSVSLILCLSSISIQKKSSTYDPSFITESNYD